MTLHPPFSLPHEILSSLIFAEGRWKIFASPALSSAQRHYNNPTVSFKICFYACLWTRLGSSSCTGTLTFLASPSGHQFSPTKKFRHLNSFSISSSASAYSSWKHFFCYNSSLRGAGISALRHFKLTSSLTKLR